MNDWIICSRMSLPPALLDWHSVSADQTVNRSQTLPLGSGAEHGDDTGAVTDQTTRQMQRHKNAEWAVKLMLYSGFW